MIDMKETGNTNVAFTSEPHTSDIKYEIAEPPKAIVEIEVLPNITVQLSRKPNWFHRLMTKLIFGWKWRDLDD